VSSNPDANDESSCGRLARCEERFRKAMNATSDGLWVFENLQDVYYEVAPGGTILNVTPSVTALSKGRLNREDLIGKSIVDYYANKPDRDALLEALQKKGGVTDYEITLRDPDGSTLSCSISARMQLDSAGKPAKIIGILRDITERHRAEREREHLQAQLTQAQKMESIGRLAGGVAHDFNNMLTAIEGNVSLALDQLPPYSPLRDYLEEAQKCARRSADLTRQLLAFARKQTVTPKLLDLNETLEGMLKMLRRLIGEEINLIWAPGINLWPVKIDPGQIDQIVANLCVNARDAIDGVGKLTLETGTGVFDETWCASHEAYLPGEYVYLSVSDNGCGIASSVLPQIFEPFFTTKSAGKGTGLGLATVYGIVKQNNGFIDVQSEPFRGTTFKIFLPRHTGQDGERAANPSQLAGGGHETILVVEDEAAILMLARRTLQRRGYTVLTAGTPSQAIRMAGEHEGRIHLLITDVIMPEMNGRDLARRLHASYPEIKRLFMSGYTADVIANHGVLDEKIPFIQKPFTVEALAQKVRETLEKPPL
jgi:two-component system cell cycle sensor histidine kinase/response regulator CckA